MRGDKAPKIPLKYPQFIFGEFIFKTILVGLCDLSLPLSANQTQNLNKFLSPLRLYLRSTFFCSKRVFSCKNHNNHPNFSALPWNYPQGGSYFWGGLFYIWGVKSNPPGSFKFWGSFMFGGGLIKLHVIAGLALRFATSMHDLAFDSHSLVFFVVGGPAVDRALAVVCAI